MKQIKGLDLISGVELVFGCCFIGTINMKRILKISVQVKDGDHHSAEMN